MWQTIEIQIDDIFKTGGSVELALCEKVYEPREQNIVLDSVHMEAIPGMFRIVLAPRRPEGETKLNLREWWEPGNTPFRGGVKFGDDEWDLRTVCLDVTVAKQLFKDFHEHGGVSDDLMQSTYSVWDRASWIKPGSI